MADTIGTDFSQIDRLVTDLGVVAVTAGPNIRKAIEVTARHVKDDWQAPLKGSSTLPALPYTIGYDIGTNVSLLSGGLANEITAEIGIDKDKSQGPLGNISEFGSPTITGRGYGLAALVKNQDDFARGLEIATAGAERAVGL